MRPLGREHYASTADSKNTVSTENHIVGTRFIASAKAKLLSISILLLLFAAGCIDSPRTRADDWAKRFPEEISGEDDPDTVFWEFDKREELSAETQSRYGQVVLFYTGEDDSIAQIDIKSYATSNAADIALLEAMRDWQLRGVRFETERGDIRCDVAQFAGGSLGYCQDADTLITISIVAEDPETEISEDSFAAIIETLGAIADNR